MIKEIDRMKKDYSKKLTKKDNENRKLKKMLLAAGMSEETIALGLST